MNSGNKGIYNLGCTCYLNSVVQCLTHLLFFHPLNKKIETDYDEKKDTYGLMKEWCRVNKQMWDNGSNQPMKVDPLIHLFVKTIRNESICFENFEQNDAEEFITLFFDMIHKTMKKTMLQKPSEKESLPWYTYFKDDNSIIVENFYSFQKLITVCSHCQKKTEKKEPFFIYQLGITKEVKTIEDAIRLDCKSETVDDWTCESCHKKTIAINKKYYQKTPDYLIIQLKRYSYTQGKKNQPISFDFTLDLPNDSSQSSRYKLLGIIVHSGGLHSGHYYAVCYNLLDKKWRVYNDTSVFLVEPDKVRKQQPYILFYKRISS